MTKSFLKIFMVMCLGITVAMVGVACKKGPGPAKDSDATLSELSVTADGAAKSAQLLPLDFDPEILEYMAAMPIGTKKIHIAATPAKSTSKISAGNTGEKTVLVGDNKFNIRVTAEDSSSKTYIITVRVPPESDEADATLDSLSINGNIAHLSPEFASAHENYVATIPAGLTQVNIGASATVTGAKIVGDGIVAVSEGTNTKIVTVTAKDTVTTKKYTLTIIVPKANSDASLNTLTVKVGASEYPLTPDFIPGVPASLSGYTVLVPSGTVAVNIAATATQGANAKVEGIGAKNVKVGENQFIVKVTAQDKTTQAYTVKVIVATADIDATLRLLNVSGGTLSPAFNPDKDEYFVIMPKGTTHIIVSAAATKSTSKVLPGTNSSRTSDYPVTVGQNKPIEIKVEAQAGNVKVYKITVTVKEKAFSGIYNIESMTFGGKTFTAGDFNINTENRIITLTESSLTGKFHPALTSVMGTWENRDKFFDDLVESLTNTFKDFILPALLTETLEETIEEWFQANEYFYPEIVMNFIKNELSNAATVAEAELRIKNFKDNLGSAEDLVILSRIQSMLLQMFLQSYIEPVDTAYTLAFDEETGEFYYDYGWMKFVEFKWDEKTDKVTATLEVIPGYNIVCTFVK